MGWIRVAVCCCLPLQLLQCSFHQPQVLLGLVVQLPGNAGLFGSCSQPPTPPVSCLQLPDAGNLPALSAAGRSVGSFSHKVD